MKAYLKNNHIYITSDDIINIDDYFFDIIENRIHHCHNEYYCNLLHIDGTKSRFKIIATSDKSLDMKFEDNTYDSNITDPDNSSLGYCGYFKVENNKIVAIGEERGRDGGWFWLNHMNNMYPALIKNKEWLNLTLLAKTLI